MGNNNIQLQFMYLNITNHCNLKCRYCYDEESKEVDNSSGQSLETYKKLSEDCSLLGLKSVAITGGEPTVNKNWFEISKLFSDKGITVKISTNGTLLNEDLAKKIKELDAQVQISLDGDEGVMSFITQVPGTYERVINAIKLLKKYDIKLNLNAVLGGHNLNAINYLNDLSKKYDVHIRFTFYKDIFNDGKGVIRALTISEIDAVLSKLNDMKKDNDNIYLSIPPLITPENFDYYYNPSCGWPINVAGVLANGDVTVCGLASCTPELVAGNINNDSFLNIWNNSKLFNDLRKLNVADLKGICKDCPVNDVCVGGCRLESYKLTKDPCAPNTMCQAYYEALLNGDINKKCFPSKMLEIA